MGLPQSPGSSYYRTNPMQLRPVLLQALTALPHGLPQINSSQCLCKNEGKPRASHCHQPANGLIEVALPGTMWVSLRASRCRPIFRIHPSSRLCKPPLAQSHHGATSEAAGLSLSGATVSPGLGSPSEIEKWTKALR
jgi:hypothetical protein